jgi:hypothetical protein
MVGGLWMTGGCEYNYVQAFAKLTDLGKMSALGKGVPRLA